MSPPGYKLQGTRVKDVHVYTVKDKPPLTLKKQIYGSVTQLVGIVVSLVAASSCRDDKSIPDPCFRAPKSEPLMDLALPSPKEGIP